jgi:CobQ-like glutamine amidotransferase family enzyme
VAVDTPEFGTLYGFENHSGRTVLGSQQSPLGRLTRGNGNNGDDGTEGARTHNAIGTYMHGPLLPTNPVLADGLLRLALERKGATLVPQALDDSLAEQARRNAATRKY